MMKRLVSLTMIALIATALLLPLTAMADSTKYVYTENGKSLNLRSEPKMGDNVIRQIPYGDDVVVDEVLSSGWSYVNWYGNYGFVQSRFLVNSKPAAKSSGTSTATKATTATNASTTTDAAKVLSDMNREFASAKKVTNPYVVVARPSRASGWVNLRWAPTTEAERIATCPQGKELIVLTEMKNWYQVQDPATGMIGFISNKYVTKK
ncbi:MAG: SH3 domain-containing protein [Clostridia bacterium]|nr:SH3 domain-containing protein [Clostridia bacterium]